jgi:hypothetical protein
MGRLERSWQLARASWGVLRQDQELLIFPVLSAIAALMVALSFFLPLFALGAFNSSVEGGFGGVGMVVTFLFYLTQYTVVFFFNSALVGAALIRLEGGDPTVKDGLRIAFDRIGAILEYAALAATVGMLLRMIQERAGFVGKLLVGMAGLGWTLATYLAVPVLVSRRMGPIDVVRESAALFRKTWGEQVAGSAGIGLAFGLLSVAAGVAGGGMAMMALSSGMVPVAVVLGGVTVGGLVGLGILSSALQGVYSAALYRYATTGSAGGAFDDRVMRGAFRPR